MRGPARVAAVSVILLVGAACSSFEPVTEMRHETIDVASVDIPGDLWEPLRPDPDSGTPVVISGRLTIPPTDRPVPAVVITHGCGGAGPVEGSWGRTLAGAGYATLVLDSFGGRGVGSICSGTETVSIPSILGDVFRAAERLREHPAIDPDAIAVMGLSFGGRTAMWSAREDFVELLDGTPFDAHLAFYPTGCYIRLADEAAVVDGPIRIFHGTADDWLPIDDCEAMVDRLRPEGVDIDLLAYEGGLHGFDNPTLQPRVLVPSAVSPRSCDFREVDGRVIDMDTGELAGVASTCVERGVTVGFDADLRDRAVDDVLAFLAEVFGER